MDPDSDPLLDRLGAGLFRDAPEGGRPAPPPEVAEAERDAARRWGRFVLVAELGEGGMGRVHKAWQADIGRWVALKVLKAAGAPAEALRREAQSAAALDDPRIPQVYEIGEWEGQVYIALQLVEGRPLDTWTLSPREAIEAIHEAAAAVGHAHSRGIVHRDLKPSNLLRTAEGRVFVTDFGLARFSGAEQTLTPRGVLAGTPGYMAPEQIRRNPDRVGPWTDVWALGASLYRLIAGEPPFGRGELAELSWRILNDDPEPLRVRGLRVHPEVDAIVGRCLEKAPPRRYRDGADLAEDLRRHLDGEAVRARPGGIGAAMRRLARRRPVLVSLASLLVVLLLGGLVWWAANQARRRALAVARVVEGQAALDKGDFDRALELFAEARSLDPDDPVARDGSASVRVAREGAEAARRRREAFDALARGRERLEAWRAARKEIAASDRPPFDAELARDRAQADARLAEAQNALHGALVLAPEQSEVRQALADFYLSQAEAEEEDDPRAVPWRFLMVAEEYDTGPLRGKLGLEGRLRVETSPSGATVSVTPLRAPDHLKSPPSGPSPFEWARAPVGPCLIQVQAKGLPAITHMLWIHRAREHAVHLDLPSAKDFEEGFVWIPGGPFMTGDDPSLPAPRMREVELDGFFIARHETTVAEYAEFLSALAQEDPQRAEGRMPPAAPGPVAERGGSVGWQLSGRAIEFHQGFARVPVTAIARADAEAYCEWRTTRARETGSRWTYRLPTGGEWEKAGRGADGRRFPWGDWFDRDACCNEINRTGRLGPVEVGSFPRDVSPYGVYDLAGNVAEWCQGGYGPMNRFAAQRGGAWNDCEPLLLQLNVGSGAASTSFMPDVGFRVVKVRAR